MKTRQNNTWALSNVCPAGFCSLQAHPPLVPLHDASDQIEKNDFGRFVLVWAKWGLSPTPQNHASHPGFAASEKKAKLGQGIQIPFEVL
jgi:hypothetical protein